MAVDSTVLDMVLYYSYTDGTDWFRVKHDLHQIFNMDADTVRTTISYIRNNWDTLYGY